MLSKYFNFIDNLRWDKDRLHLIFWDNSNDSEFAKILKAFLANTKCKSATYVCDDSKNVPLLSGEIYNKASDKTKYIISKMAKIYNAFRSMCSTELGFILEDDVIPQTNVIHYLIDNLTPTVGIVGQAYCTRSSGKRFPIAWSSKDVTPLVLDKRLEANENGHRIPVSVCGTGAMLIRSLCLKMHPFRASFQDENYGVDYLFCRDAWVSGFQVMLDARLPCRHYRSGSEYV